jgi:hypothetical protein
MEKGSYLSMCMSKCMSKCIVSVWVSVCQYLLSPAAAANPLPPPRPPSSTKGRRSGLERGEFDENAYVFI